VPLSRCCTGVQALAANVVFRSVEITPRSRIDPATTLPAQSFTSQNRQFTSLRMPFMSENRPFTAAMSVCLQASGTPVMEDQLARLELARLQQAGGKSIKTIKKSIFQFKPQGDTFVVSIVSLTRTDGTSIGPVTETAGQNSDPPAAPVTPFPVGIPSPPNHSYVTVGTPLLPGTKLAGCRGGKWEVVTVVRLIDHRYVECTWDNFGPTKYTIERHDLRIDNNTLALVRYRQRGPVLREWSDSTGEFKIMATYVDSKQGWVLLRKRDGKQIRVQ